MRSGALVGVSFGPSLKPSRETKEQVRRVRDRAGRGRQHKVAVGDVLEVDRRARSRAASLTPLLVVDGDTVTSGAAGLAGATGDRGGPRRTKGPKVRILKFKKNTRSPERQGHRQRHTQVKVTGSRS